MMIVCVVVMVVMIQLMQNMFRPSYDGERCSLEPRTLSTAEVAGLSTDFVERRKMALSLEVSLLLLLA